MAFSSFTWPFRRGAGAGPSKPSAAAEGKEEDAEGLGVTPQLLDFLRTLSPDAFKSSALQLPHQGTPPSSPLDSAHLLVQSRSLTVMCHVVSQEPPRSSRTGSSGTPSSCSPEPRYELRAIQKEKVRRMETENGKSKDATTVEVEMQESRCSRECETLPDDSDPQDS
ncbi:hypothetical protein D1007_51572 [Hordeum vulgare]|nr:hypothetical protein D1007_51572 [Hordeum vulgare]